MSICWNRLSPKVADSYIAVWKILLWSQDTELYERWKTVLLWSQDMGVEGSGSLSVQLLNNDTQPSSFLISSQISRLKFLRVHIFFTTHDKPTNKKTTKNNKKQQKTTKKQTKNKKQNKTKQNKTKHKIIATWYLKAFLLLICNNWEAQSTSARVQCWWKTWR